MTRKDHKLAEEYAKDADDEAFLGRLNAALRPHEEAGYADLEERWPTVHVVGAPRSGTTLLTQLVASHFAIGNISNLAAAFWQAPVHGIRLSRKLLGWGQPSNLASDYGRTSALSEPHEFGYFWSSILGYSELREPDDASADPVDWERVRRVMVNMTAAARAPIVFKSFMLGFYTAEVQRVLPGTCFVLVHRDPVDNALSILRMRRQYSGDITAWTSVKPREYPAFAEADPVTQAAAQALLVERAYRRAFDRIGGRNCLVLSYEQLCEAPLGALHAVAGLLEQAGGAPPAVDVAAPRLSARCFPHSAERSAVRAALDTLRENYP
ncbi:MAG: LPS sulfotransferase NodH [Myxococcota bacterium]|jgi:LPS sulfotransferase NodH